MRDVHLLSFSTREKEKSKREQWEIEHKIMLSCDCFSFFTSTLEVNRLQGQKNCNTTKLNTSMNTPTRGFMCTDTCAHAQIELCVSRRKTQGLHDELCSCMQWILWCCHCPSGTRVNHQAGKDIRVKLRWHSCVPSCSIATHQAPCSRHCWGKNKVTNQLFFHPERVCFVSFNGVWQGISINPF